MSFSFFQMCDIISSRQLLVWHSLPFALFMRSSGSLKRSYVVAGSINMQGDEWTINEEVVIGIMIYSGITKGSQYWQYWLPGSSEK